MNRRPPRSTLFPYPTLFRSVEVVAVDVVLLEHRRVLGEPGVPAGVERVGRDAGRVVEEVVAIHVRRVAHRARVDRKSTRLNSSHANISYAVFCLKKKQNLFLLMVVNVLWVLINAQVVEAIALRVAAHAGTGLLMTLLLLGVLTIVPANAGLYTIA